MSNQEILPLEELNFYSPQKEAPSFDPVDSDTIGNQLFMKHLVSTLVRYKSGGEFIPYIAVSWDSSQDMKSWKFNLRKGLFCENGEPITARGYKVSLERNLKIYSHISQLPYFRELIGIEELNKTGEISGLIAGDDSITFNFDQPVSTGFLEYLSMPYYGYYCADNISAGKWKNKNAIISSGPYRLSQTKNFSDRYHVLELRTDWPLLQRNSKAPRLVKIWHNKDNKFDNLKNSIIQTTEEANLEENGLKKILGAPDILYSIVLDINEKSPFRIFENREHFRALILEEIAKANAEPGPTTSFTKTMFIDENEADIARPKKHESFFLESWQKQVNILSTTTNLKVIPYMEILISNALSKVGLTPNFRRIGEDPDVSYKDKTSRKKFDIRITSVYSGSTFDAWVADMMFCSDLGVSFPDPSGNICITFKSFLKSNQSSKKSVLSTFTKTMSADSSVIPIAHIRNAFFHTPDIDARMISPDTIVIDFEDIQKK